jgi:hypothetical protein
LFQQKQLIMSIDLLSAQKGIGKKLLFEEMQNVITSMYNLFMTKDVFFSFDEYILLLETKMDIYNIRWMDIYDIMDEDEAGCYAFDIKDYFQYLINRIDIISIDFYNAATVCMDFSKSVKPKFY